MILSQYKQVMVVLGRLHRFAAILETGKPITARKLADQEEISTKTVYRTIDFLRDQLGWCIDGDHLGLRLTTKGREPLNPK